MKIIFTNIKRKNIKDSSYSLSYKCVVIEMFLFNKLSVGYIVYYIMRVGFRCGLHHTLYSV